MTMGTSALAMIGATAASVAAARDDFHVPAFTRKISSISCQDRFQLSIHIGNGELLIQPQPQFRAGHSSQNVEVVDIRVDAATPRRNRR